MKMQCPNMENYSWWCSSGGECCTHHNTASSASPLLLRARHKHPFLLCCWTDSIQSDLCTLIPKWGSRACAEIPHGIDGRCRKRALLCLLPRTQIPVEIHSSEWIQIFPVRTAEPQRCLAGARGFFHRTDSSAANTGKKCSGEEKGPSRKNQGVEKQAIFNP